MMSASSVRNDFIAGSEVTDALTCPCILIYHVCCDHREQSRTDSLPDVRPHAL